MVLISSTKFQIVSVPGGAHEREATLAAEDSGCLKVSPQGAHVLMYEQ